jgi:hypothetical protein
VALSKGIQRKLNYGLRSNNNDDNNNNNNNDNSNNRNVKIGEKYSQAQQYRREVQSSATIYFTIIQLS